jgi:hypothetical protein
MQKTSASEWIQTYPAEIMVCDAIGTILEMSDVAIQIYEKEGGAAMIGKNVFDHHNESTRKQIIATVNKRLHVIYTTKKGGLKKLVSIAPWYHAGEYAGFVLITLDLPDNIPNINKD